LTSDSSEKNVNPSEAEDISKLPSVDQEMMKE